VKPVSQFHHGASKSNRLVSDQAHMAEHRGLSLGSAIERLIDAGALGIVLLDSKLRVVARHGTLVEWVPLDLAVGEALPFLVGYEDVLEAVGRGRDESFHLAKIRLSGVERGETSVYSIHAFASVETDGVLLLFQDATEVAMLEQRVLQQRNELALTQKALNRAKLDAESANRAKSAFLANVSHELRTPLNVIIGDAEILRDQTPAGMDSAELETYLSDIHDSGLFLLELINDLLDLSKAEAGRMELIEEAVLPYAKGLEFTQVVEPAHITLLADGRRLKQVLLNLLSNAAKFTPEGGRVTVEASVGDGHFTIWVSDTGSGIAAEDLERLTEPFVQLARSADGPAGTGLGLHLVKTFVELHGGQISMASEPGGGTTVTLRFPPERLAD
jgi:signal transduction histidine kinase